MKLNQHWFWTLGLTLAALVINFGLYAIFSSSKGPKIEIIHVQKLERFFLISKTSEQRYLIIENEKQFDQHFHPAALNGINAIRPDFSREWVIAIDDAETDQATEITILKCEIQERSLRVICQINRGTKQSYTMHPQSAVILPRLSPPINQTIERIDFCDEVGKVWATHIRKP